METWRTGDDRPDTEVGSALREMGLEVQRLSENQSRSDSRLVAAVLQLTHLVSTVDRVRDDLRSVNSQLGVIRGDLTRLVTDFGSFAQRYQRDQVRTAAEGELNRLTTEWNAKFAQRRQTRMLARGLVHTLTADAVRQGAINHDTVQACAAERMLLEPTFWLAPAAMAVAVGFRDETERAHRARSHAYALDQAKANLFFALTCSRLGEQHKAAVWMDQYLQSLDPDELSHDFLVVLDAIAGDELGLEAQTYAQRAMERWMQESARTEEDGWGPHGRLAQNMYALRRDLRGDDAFASFRKLCGDQWASLRAGWEDASVLACSLEHLRREFPGARRSPAVWHREDAGRRPRESDTRYVDSALERLVNRLEPDEEAMRRRMEWLRQVVAHDGDRDAARAADNAGGGAEDEPVDFATLLERAVFTPAKVPLTTQARRFALETVWQNIQDLSAGFAERSEQAFPDVTRLSVDGWSVTVSSDPSVPGDARLLKDGLTEYLEQRIGQRVQAVTTAVSALIGGAAGLLAVAPVVLLIDGGLRVTALALSTLPVLWAGWELTRVPLLRRRLRREGADDLWSQTELLARGLREHGLFFEDWRRGLAAVNELRAWSPGGGATKHTGL